MPQLYRLVRLSAFDQDLFGIGRYSERGTLVRMALAALRVDPRHALGTFRVFIDTSEGWVLYRLVLPDKRGVIEYEIDTYERVVVLHRIHWR